MILSADAVEKKINQDNKEQKGFGEIPAYSGTLTNTMEVH